AHLLCARHVRHSLGVGEIVAEIEQAASIALDRALVEHRACVAGVLRFVSATDQLQDVQLLAGVLDESREELEASAVAQSHRAIRPGDAPYVAIATQRQRLRRWVFARVQAFEERGLPELRCELARTREQAVGALAIAVATSQTQGSRELVAH